MLIADKAIAIIAVGFALAGSTLMAADPSCDRATVDGETVAAPRVVEVCDDIDLANTTVAGPGGSLRLRAGNGIGLGPGLVVEDGATLAVQPVCLSGDCSAPPPCTTAFAVGYEALGNTCNFVGNPGAPELPWIALDEYRYNELFSGGGHNAPFGETGGVFGAVGEGRGCGACLEITGPNGTIVGMVREIADIGAVGMNAYPSGVHIDTEVINEVRPGSGGAVNVAIRPVPCPITGTIRVRYEQFSDLNGSYWLALYFVFYNHVDPIVSAEIRAAEGHTQWYPLNPDWLGRWIEENFTAGDFYTVIPVPDPPQGPVIFRLRSLYGEEVVSDPVQLPVRPNGAPSGNKTYYDTGVQFATREITPAACTQETTNWDCGNQTLEPHEQCESVLLDSTPCAGLGAGTGVAWCNPTSCEWDTRTCSAP